MRLSIKGCATALCLLAGSAHAGSAEAVLQSMIDKQVARWEGIALYSMTQEVMGQSVTNYFQRFQLKLDDGRVIPSFHPVPSTAFLCSKVASEPMTSDEINAYLRGLGGGDGVSADTAANTNAGSMMMMNDLMQKAELIGEASIDGNAVWHVQGDNLNYTEGNAEGSFTIEEFSMWIDQSRLVPLQLHMNGRADTPGEERVMDMKIQMSDYRPVPGTQMLESFSQAVSVGGALSADEMADVAEAQKQLAELDKQMASMPPAQRKMMEGMMGDQIKVFRELAESGAVKIDMTVSSIVANQDVAGETCSL
ncbi:MAG: hypothetical protein AB8F65_08135 [Woeseiaceae bacterium]